MTIFNCTHCGYQRAVKPELAGKQARCPKCKQPGRVSSPTELQTRQVDEEEIVAQLEPKPATGPQTLVSCPFCAESIMPNAIKCKHCSEFLTGASKSKDSRDMKTEIGSIVFGVIGATIFLVGLVCAGSAIGMDTAVDGVHNTGLQQKQMISTIVGIAISAFGAGVIYVALNQNGRIRLW